MTQLTDTELARMAIGLLDLTSLNEEDDEAAIAALCRRALTPPGGWRRCASTRASSASPAVPWRRWAPVICASPP